MFICLWKPGFGQEVAIVGGDNSHLLGEGWIAPQDVAILKSMKLKYKKPRGFKEAYRASECFEPNSKLSLSLTCVVNKLYTKEEDFIAFMPLHRVFGPEEIADWKKIIPNFNYDVDQILNSNLKRIIRVWYGDEAAGDWEQYVTYYPTAEAKRKFNADKAVTFSIKLDSAEYFDRYKYLDVFSIQKKGRGSVSFYCFYDEKGKKNLAKYKKAIEGVLRYED